MTTIREALAAGIRRLSATSTSPRLDAQLLLCHVLNVEKPYLVAHDDEVLSAANETAFSALLKRRADDEPIAYILGSSGFYDLDLRVTPAVLVPRSETEHLVEWALAEVDPQAAVTIADIGTGSGAIAVTVAKHRPQATVHATDVSTDALAVARQNAVAVGVAVQFHVGSLAEPLIAAGIRVDVLLANLPYIAADEVLTLAVSKHEPILALDGGPDGFNLIRALLRQVPQVCVPQARIFLEIGADQGMLAGATVAQILPDSSTKIIPDYAGRDRVVQIHYRP